MGIINAVVGHLSDDRFIAQVNTSASGLMGLMNRDGGQIGTPLRRTLRSTDGARSLPIRRSSEPCGRRSGAGQRWRNRTDEEILTPHSYVGNSQERPRVSVMIYYWMVNCQIAAAPVDAAGALRDRTL